MVARSDRQRINITGRISLCVHFCILIKNAQEYKLFAEICFPTNIIRWDTIDLCSIMIKIICEHAAIGRVI